jgi:hypothetical protein
MSSSDVTMMSMSQTTTSSHMCALSFDLDLDLDLFVVTPSVTLPPPHLPTSNPFVFHSLLSEVIVEKLINPID